MTVHVNQSDNTGLQGALVKYSCGGPVSSFGTTDSSGTATKNIADGASCSFWAGYRGTTSPTQVKTVVGGLSLTFQTSAVTVTLSDHNSNPLAGGAVGYQAGTSTYWLNATPLASRTMLPSGGVTGELFDGTYDFRMQYNGGTEWKTAVVVSGATPVAFQTGLLTVVYSGLLSYGQPTNSDSAWFTKAGTELLPGTYVFHPRGVGYPVNSGCTSVSITSPAAGTSATKTILAAQLRDSTGAALGGGQASYTVGSTSYLNGPTSATSGASCQVVNGALTNVKVTMVYNGTGSAKTQDVTVNSIFAFQTSAVTVTLSNHSGGPLSGGVVAFKTGSSTIWLNNTPAASTTDGTGAVVGQLFDGTYDFRMQYNGGTEWKNGVVISGATTVPFQTGLLTLVYSSTISYGQGSPTSAWFTKPSMELLPGTYLFRPSGSGCLSLSIDAPAAGDSATKSIFAAQLLDHSGAALMGGAAEYAPGGTWLPMGTTDATGWLCKVVDGALGNTQVRMSYHQADVTKFQDVASASLFFFKTTLATIRLIDHGGNGLAGGVIDQGGGFWDPGIATTDSSGNAYVELFSGSSYKFRMNYNYTSQEQTLPFPGSFPMVFQTGSVHSESGYATQWAGGSWNTFVQDMEVLPGYYHFQFSDGTPITYYTINGGTVNSIH